MQHKTTNKRIPQVRVINKTVVIKSVSVAFWTCLVQMQHLINDHVMNNINSKGQFVE